jgi:glycosyltransferase involved in cell wall biosynthesis
MKKVLHIISSLSRAGAENIVYELVKNSKDVESSVVSLTGEGYFSKHLRLCGAFVYDLNVRTLSGLFKFAYQVNKIKHDCVFLHMYHSMFFFEIFKVFDFKVNKIWCFHHENPKSTSIGRIMSFVVYILMLISKIKRPDAIFLSDAACKAHEKYGFNFGRTKIINNGVDLNRFNVDLDSRQNIRSKYKLENVFVIGNVARWAPIKNHELLFRIVKNLNFLNYRLVLSGIGITHNNYELTQLIKKYKLEESVILLGECENISEIMNSFDIHILTSKMEGFGLVTAEAMACGVPCLSTNVGQQKEIISDCGFVGLEKDIYSFVKYIFEFYNFTHGERQRLSQNCRKHIVKKYDISDMVKSYLLFGGV